MTNPTDPRALRAMERERALKIILELHAKHTRHRDIAAELTRQGITPANGLPGTPWCYSSVSAILRRYTSPKSRRRAA